MGIWLRAHRVASTTDHHSTPPTTRVPTLSPHSPALYCRSALVPTATSAAASSPSSVPSAAASSAAATSTSDSSGAAWWVTSKQSHCTSVPTPPLLLVSHPLLSSTSITTRERSVSNGLERVTRVAKFPAVHASVFSVKPVKSTVMSQQPLSFSLIMLHKPQ